MAWEYCTGAPWRHVPERFGKWNSLCKRFTRWAQDGTWDRLLAATIPERDDQIAHRRKKPGRPIEFGDEQRARYRGRNVVERCFNQLKRWRGIAPRSDKTARGYRAAITLAAL